MKYTISMKPTVKELTNLWAEVIKARAGHKSEYKDIFGSPLHAHHIIGKPTLALRFSLDNGVCITGGQHFFVAHHAGRSADFKTWVLQKRGITEEQLKITSRNKVDMFAMKIYLQEKLNEYTLSKIVEEK